MDERKVRKYLMIGLMGAFITLVGEMLEGYVDATDTSNRLNQIFSSIENLSTWQIGLGSTIGVVGILMQFFGYQAIYLTFKDKTNIYAKIYHIGLYNFSVIGAIVHVLCSVWMYIYRISNVENTIDYIIWFMLPIVFVFYVGYFLFCGALLMQMKQEQTTFPRWCWILNPLFGKIILNMISEMLPNSALSNGIGFSNMGMTSCIILGVLLIQMNRNGGKKDA